MTDTVISRIDNTKRSVEERLYAINLKQRRFVLSSLVLYGKNSGCNIVESFSNMPGSLKSSLGSWLPAKRTGVSSDTP